LFRTKSDKNSCIIRRSPTYLSVNTKQYHG
jgi:hypothetical protein